MIARRLSIDPALLVSMFSRPDAWRAVANRLPEDAKVKHVNYVGEVLDHKSVHIWITSRVFRDDDPVDLPAVKLEAVPIEPECCKPVDLTSQERLEIEAKFQALANRNFGDRVKVYDSDVIAKKFGIPTEKIEAMNQQFGPSPLQKVWLEIQVMQGHEAALDAILRHCKPPSIEERLTDAKYDLPAPVDVDIKQIRYKPSDFIGF